MHATKIRIESVRIARDASVLSRAWASVPFTNLKWHVNGTSFSGEHTVFPCLVFTVQKANPRGPLFLAKLHEACARSSSDFWELSFQLRRHDKPAHWYDASSEQAFHIALYAEAGELDGMIVEYVWAGLSGNVQAVLRRLQFELIRGELDTAS